MQSARHRRARRLRPSRGLVPFGRQPIPLSPQGRRRLLRRLQGLGQLKPGRLQSRNRLRDLCRVFPRRRRLGPGRRQLGLGRREEVRILPDLAFQFGGPSRRCRCGFGARRQLRALGPEHLQFRPQGSRRLLGLCRRFARLRAVLLRHLQESLGLLQASRRLLQLRLELGHASRRRRSGIRPRKQIGAFRHQLVPLGAQRRHGLPCRLQLLNSCLRAGESRLTRGQPLGSLPGLRFQFDHPRGGRSSRFRLRGQRRPLGRGRLKLSPQGFGGLLRLRRHGPRPGLLLQGHSQLAGQPGALLVLLARCRKVTFRLFDAGRSLLQLGLKLGQARGRDGSRLSPRYEFGPLRRQTITLCPHRLGGLLRRLQRLRQFLTRLGQRRHGLRRLGGGLTCGGGLGPRGRKLRFSGGQTFCRLAGLGLDIDQPRR